MAAKKKSKAKKSNGRKSQSAPEAQEAEPQGHDHGDA